MTSGPKIALFDIETAPSLGYFWGKLYETDIIKVHSPWYMLCFSYKWLGQKRIHTHSLRNYPGYRDHLEDDRKLVKDLHRVFDEADILIAHNGDRFDIRKTYAKFLKYGYGPPTPARSIDTLKILRKHFLLDSSRLAAAGEYLGLGGKIPHNGFELWQRVMRGVDAAWDEMEHYNRRDVELLDQVYQKIRPYATTHPNLALYHEHRDTCPRCQSARIHGNGVRPSNSRWYRRYRCTDCGHSFSGEWVNKHNALTERKARRGQS